MSENKEERKGFWGTLLGLKKKSVCCQIDTVSENTGMTDAPACRFESAKNETKVIKVLGTGCSSCKALYNIVKEAVEQLGIAARVEKEENLEKIMAYNVMSLPALVVDGKVVSKGQKRTVEQVKKLIL